MRQGFPRMLENLISFVYAAAVVLVLFNLTIFVHELGHFWAGRRRGAKIERFAIWFGPALWKRRIGGVEFRLGCIPVGGYVAFPQLAMEAVEGKSETPSEELRPLAPRDKIPILFAGSFANVLLAFAIACVVWAVGVPRDARDLDLSIGYVPEGSAERAAGILPGDRILRVNGATVRDWDEVHQKVALSRSSRVRLTLDRDGREVEAEVLPSRDHLFGLRRLAVEHGNVPVAAAPPYKDSPAAAAGVREGDEFLEVNGARVLGARHLVEMVSARPDQPTRLVVLRKGQRVELTVVPKMEKNAQAARIGVPLDTKRDERLVTIHPTPWFLMTKSFLLMADTLNALFHPRTTGVGVKDLSGPVGILEMLYRVIRLDLRLALAFTVLLNINLAVINLLPIPVLDGGHILFSLVEMVRRRPIHHRVMEVTNTIFVALLITFMVYVTFNDLVRRARIGKFESEQRAAAPPPAPEFEKAPAPAK